MINSTGLIHGVAVFADPPPAGSVTLYLGKLALLLGDHQLARTVWIGRLWRAA